LGWPPWQRSSCTSSFVGILSSRSSCTRSSSGITQRLARLIVVGAVFLAVLEIAARLDDRLAFGAAFFSNPSLSDLWVSDQNGIHGRPFARYKKWRMNSLGLLGVETSLQKPPGTLRVVVLGASESFGLYEREGLSYPDQLQRLLAASLRSRVEVLNAALPGMSLPRVIEFCQQHLASLQADIVVYYPSPATYLSEDAPSEVFQPPPRTQSSSLRFLPKLVSGINRSLPSVVQGRRLDVGQRRALLALRRGRPESWFFRDVPRDRLDLFEAHLTKLVACLLRAGVRPIVTTHANRFTAPTIAAEEPHLVAWQIFYPRADGNVLIAMDRAGNEVLRRVARRFGIRLVDVAAALPAGPRCFRDFVHFSDEGSTLVAHQLLEGVLEEMRSNNLTGG
jgi:hypothetical protein